MCQSLSCPSALYIYIYSDSCNLHDGHRHAIFMIEDHFYFKDKETETKSVK